MFKKILGVFVAFGKYLKDDYFGFGATVPQVEDIEPRPMLTIFWLEDEPRRMTHYYEVVKAELAEIADLELRMFSDVDEAWVFVQEHYRQIDVAILDIMLPPGNFCKDDRDEEVSLGFRTGARFFERMCQLKKIPTIFFTNVYDLSLQQRLAILGMQGFFQKKSLLPHEFANEVRKVAKVCLEAKELFTKGHAPNTCTSKS